MKKDAPTRKRIFLLAAIVMIVVIVGLWAVLYTDGFRSWLEGELSERASSALGRQTELSIDRLRPHSLEIGLSDVLVRGTRADGEPLLTVGDLQAKGRWAELLRGRLELAELRISDLRLDLTEIGPGERDGDSATATGSWLGPVVIRNLDIDGSSVRFVRAEVPVEVAADGVELQASWRHEAAGYRGSVQVSAGRIRWPAVAPDLPVSLRSGFFLSEHGLVLDAAEVNAPGLELTGRSEYRSGRESTLSADLHWQARPGELPVSLLGRLDVSGAANGEAGIRGVGSSITANVDFEGAGLVIQSVPVESVAGQLIWNERGLRVTDLEGRIAGMEISGEGQLGLVESSPQAVTAAVTFRADEIGPLFELAGIMDAKFAGSLDGEVSIEGTAADWEALRGRYQVRAEDLHPTSAPARTLRVAARGGFAGGVVELEAVEVTGPGVAVSASGLWRPSGRSELKGSAKSESWKSTVKLLTAYGMEVDAPWASRLEEVEEVEGAVDAEFAFSAPLDKGLDWKLAQGSLKLRGERLFWVHQPAYEVTSELSLLLDRGAPALDRWRVDAPGLSATIVGLRTPAGQRRYEIALEASEISPTASTLVAFLACSSECTGSPSSADWQRAAARLAGGLSLIGSVSGWSPDARIEDLAGAFDLALRNVSFGEPGEDGLTATLTSAFADGELNIGRLHARMAGVEGKAAGRLGREGATGLVLQLEAPSLATSLERVRSQWEELAVGSDLLARIPDVSGALTAEVLASGLWATPEVTGSLNVGELELAGHAVGDLVARVDTHGRLLRYAGHAGQEGNEVELDGEIAFEGERQITLRARIARQPLTPFAELAGLADRVSGEIEGRFEMAWPGGEGSGNVSLVDAAFAGFPIEGLETEWTVDPEALEILRGDLRAAGGALSFDGRLGAPSQTGAIRFTGEGMQLGNLVAAFDLPIDISGTVSLEGQVAGSAKAPRLEARLATEETRLLQQRTPNLNGSVALDRSGLRVDLSSDDADSSVSWAMDFAENGLWSAALEYPVRVALDQWLSGDSVATGSIVEGVLQGNLQMPAGRLELAVGRIKLDDGRVSAAGYPLRLDGGLEAILDAKTARVLPFRLRGEGTELTVEAELTRGPTPSLAIHTKGRLDLRTLQALSPGLKTSGMALVDLETAGPWPAFDWKGTATVQDGAVQHLDFPAAVDKLRAQVEMGPGDWTLQELSARLGGGSLSASGKVAMEGFHPGDYRIDLAGVNVRLNYPEGLRSQFDAALVLARSGKGPARLSGRATVVRGLYDRDVGLERSVLARRRGLETAPEIGRSWTDDVTLELSMLAPEGLWVRNDLASLESRGELKVQGTLSRPRVSGRIEALEGGRIFFRDVSYFVTQGSFDYLGGSIADPRLAIRAETSISEYDITLTVSGWLSEPVFELTSSPSLPTADIVTLLVTGSTRDQFASGAGGLSQAQAATYLSSGLTKKLQSSLRKSLGLDEVSLDPVLVEGQTNPTARVTVGKSITPRLSATYSSRLGTAQKDVYQTKFRLSESLNLVGTRDDDGSLAADIRYSASRLQRSKETGAPRAGAVGDIEGRPKIRGIEISGNAFADDSTLRKLLNLRAGEDFRKARLLEALERVRDWYLEKRHPEADTAYRILETDNGVELEIDIEEGREVRFRFNGFKNSKHLERSLLELWSRSLFREDIVRDAATRVAELLAQDGYVSASAEGELHTLAGSVVEAVFSIEPGPRVRVAGVAFRGNSFLDDKEIREEVLTRRGYLRASWLDPKLLAEDAEFIRALYVSSGFLEAAVGFQMDFQKSDRRAELTFDIEEGRRFTLRSFRFSGNEEVGRQDLERALSVSIGEPYREETIRSAQAGVEQLYDRLGYPDARVVTEAGVDRDAKAVDLVLVIEEGARQRVEVVEIDNAGITRESVIRREIELTAGEPLGREQIAATQYRLYRTGLFRSVRVERFPGITPESQRLRVSVEEAKNFRTDYGVGFDSEEGVRVTANVSHSNVGGGRLYVGGGGRWSPVDQRFQLLVRNPAMGGSRVVGLASAFWEDEERENFNAVRTGFSLQLGKDYRERRISVNAGLDLVDLDEKQTVAAAAGSSIGNRTTRLGSLRFGVARSTRDSSFWPTTGSYARAETSLFHSALASEVEFARLFVQWSRYSRVLGEGVWSVGLRSGIAKSFGTSIELPISERYFAGGETSLRGFSLDSVVASGTPPGLAMELTPGESLGGDALLVLNQELTLPIRDPLHALVFYDVGNLYWRLEDFDPTDLRHSAGVGLRVRSPFGAIRLEYGWKLDRRQTESAGQAHFSLGLAF